MDRILYFPTNKNYGIYAARRLPKGPGSIPSIAARDGSAGPVTDSKPNFSVIPARFVASDLTPHADTQRWTYTVPKGRRAQVQNAFTAMQRKTAGAPNATSQININIVRSGKTLSEIIAIATSVLGVASADDRTVAMTAPTIIDLFEDDQIRASSVDVSTGGTIDYFAYATIVEFDSAYSYTPNNQGQFDVSSIPPRATFGTGATAGFLMGDWLKQFTG